MSQKSGSVKEPAEKVVQNIRRATRKRYSAEEKIRVVLEGLRNGSCKHRIGSKAY
jgi:transposase